MFSRVKSKAAVIAGVILTMATLSAGQGFHLENVPEKQNVQLQIFSSDGKLLRNLINGPQKMGEYSALWDGRTDNGQLMAVGSYYYRLKVGDFVSSKKMVELK